MLSVNEEIKTDVMVIGGGGAGCWAALKATEHGADVLLLNQYPMGKSGSTILAKLSYQAVMGELGNQQHDSEDIFFEDMNKGGAFLGDQNLIEVFVRNSKKTVIDYEKLGVHWSKKEGKFNAFQLPGMSVARGCFTDFIKLNTGFKLKRALVKAVRSRNNIHVLEGKAIKVLIAAGRAAGVLVFDFREGTLVKIRAKAVIIATGGAGRLYKRTSMPEDAKGDGMALALKAGANLVDLEFQQFFPVVLCHPESLAGQLLPSLYGQGGKILNARKEEFLHTYIPESESNVDRSLEYAKLDVTSIAIMKEVEKGNGTPHGGVYLDVSHVDDLCDRFPAVFKDLKMLKVDFEKEPLEICPSHHFSVGGIYINEFCETNIPGLYAAGEVAANLHGANRITAAALPECAVFGQIAGSNAEIYSNFIGWPSIPTQKIESEVDRLEKILERGSKGEIRPIRTIKDLQDTMFYNVGVVRNEKSLKEALEKMNMLRGTVENLEISHTRTYNNELVDAIDLENMLLLSEAITKAALQRTESRGNHYREDFPDQDDKNWQKHSKVAMIDGKIELSTCPRRITRHIQSDHVH